VERRNKTRETKLHAMLLLARDGSVLDWNRTRKYFFIGAVVSTLCCSLSCRKQPTPSEQTRASIPSPPDLRRCTRLEARYLPSVVDCLFRTREQQKLLSPEESAHLRLLEVFIVDKPERIEALAHKIARATHIDTSVGRPHVADVMRVTCSRGEQIVASFTIREFGCIQTTDGEWFDLTGTGMDIFEFTPEVQPFIARLGCVRSLYVTPARTTYANSEVARGLRTRIGGATPYNGVSLR